MLYIKLSMLYVYMYVTKYTLPPDQTYYYMYIVFLYRTSKVWLNGAYSGNLYSGSKTALPESDVTLALAASLSTGTPSDVTDMAIDELLFEETDLTNTIVSTRYSKYIQ